MLYIGAAIGSMRLPAVFTKYFPKLHQAVSRLGSTGPEDASTTPRLGRSLFDSLHLFEARTYRRTLGDDALIGGCAAITAFFDHPASGCLFVLELPNMHGSVQRGYLLPPALVASVAAWYTHRQLMDWGYMPPAPSLPAVYAGPQHLLMAIPLGLFSALAGWVYIHAKHFLDKLPFPVWLRGLVMGLIVGIIGVYEPDTFTWGEFQIDILANYRTPLTIGMSTALAFSKFASTTFTVSSGYTAGIVYPMVMIGYLFGPLGAAILRPETVLGLELPDLFASSERSPVEELVSQALASGFLAATMRAPFGSSMLVYFMSRKYADESVGVPFLSLLLLTNFIAVYFNPLSGLGQV